MCFGGKYGWLGEKHFINHRLLLPYQLQKLTPHMNKPNGKGDLLNFEFVFKETPQENKIKKLQKVAHSFWRKEAHAYGNRW